MRKFIIVTVLFVILGVLLCGCDRVPVQQSTTDLTYANIYREASALGYEGTLQDFLELVKGVDGNGISGIEIDKDGYLVVTYTKEQKDFVIGKVKGDKGEKGIDGVSITKVELNESGELIITLSSDINTPINLGKVVGVDALKGKDGKDGINGANGTNGTNGLIGKNGTNGKDGINGTNGNNGTNGIAGENGTNGMDGIDGENGKDGINGTNGNDGINGTNGNDGINGENGTNGNNGTNGKSAYELYIYYYPEYTKTEKEWLLDFIKGNLIQKFNVTFHYYQGKADSIISVLEADKVSKPSLEATARTGYNFLSWNIGSIAGEQYEFDSEIYSNLQLYATYERCEPILENKGQIVQAIIPIESLYRYSLMPCMLGLSFEATQGKLECNVYSIDNSLLVKSTQVFTVSNQTLIMDLSEYSEYVETLYIIVSYRGEIGTLVINYF